MVIRKLNPIITSGAHIFNFFFQGDFFTYHVPDKPAYYKITNSYHSTKCRSHRAGLHICTGD